MTDQEFENRLVKHYWVRCLNPKTNEVNLNRVDPSNDFSSIPKNSKGKTQLEVGELRDIVKEVIKQTEKRINTNASKEEDREQRNKT